MCAKKCKKGKCSPEKCDNGSCANTTTVTTTAKLSLPPLSVGAAGVGIQPVAKKAASAETTVAIDDPAAAIRDGGTEFHNLYSQYLALRELAMPLNGLPQTDPLPTDVKITKVTLEFSVAGKTNTAEIPGVTHISEVSVLIGSGLRNVIDKMYQTLFTLGHVASSMQNAVQQAVVGRNGPNSTVTLKNNNDNEKTV